MGNISHWSLEKLAELLETAICVCCPLYAENYYYLVICLKICHMQYIVKCFITKKLLTLTACPSEIIDRRWNCTLYIHYRKWLWNHPYCGDVSFNWCCSLILIINWRQMLWDYHIYNVAVVDAYLKKNTPSMNEQFLILSKIFKLV